MFAWAITVIAAASVADLRVPVDPASSYIRVELCALGSCGSDTSPLTGYLEVALRPRRNPSELALRDFDVQATESLTIRISYGLLGRIDAVGTGLGAAHADPGPHQPFVPITGGEYVFVGVPYMMRGLVDYTATGIVCGLMQGAGLPCSDRIDLAEQPPDTADEISGTIELTGQDVRLAGKITITQPIDPDNPDLGTMAGTIILSGSAALPAPGDLDEDGDVDLNDFAGFQACFNGAARPPTIPGCELADVDGDGDVDLNDFAQFQACFNGSGRPPACW